MGSVSGSKGADTTPDKAVTKGKGFAGCVRGQGAGVEGQMVRRQYPNALRTSAFHEMVGGNSLEMILSHIVDS